MPLRTLNHASTSEDLNFQDLCRGRYHAMNIFFCHKKKANKLPKENRVSLFDLEYQQQSMRGVSLKTNCLAAYTGTSTDQNLVADIS